MDTVHEDYTIPYGEKTGFTKIDNALIDYAMSKMEPSAWVVMTLILRRTKGWKKEAAFISLSQFQEVTGLSLPTIRKMLKWLEDKEYILAERNGQKTVSYQLHPSLEVAHKREKRESSKGRGRAKKEKDFPENEKKIFQKTEKDFPKMERDFPKMEKDFHTPNPHKESIKETEKKGKERASHPSLSLFFSEKLATMFGDDKSAYSEYAMRIVDGSAMVGIDSDVIFKRVVCIADFMKVHCQPVTIDRRGKLLKPAIDLALLGYSIEQLGEVFNPDGNYRKEANIPPKSKLYPNQLSDLVQRSKVQAALVPVSLEAQAFFDSFIATLPKNSGEGYTIRNYPNEVKIVLSAIKNNNPQAENYFGFTAADVEMVDRELLIAANGHIQPRTNEVRAEDGAEKKSTSSLTLLSQRICTALSLPNDSFALELSALKQQCELRGLSFEEVADRAIEIAAVMVNDCLPPKDRRGKLLEYAINSALKGYTAQQFRDGLKANTFSTKLHPSQLNKWVNENTKPVVLGKPSPLAVAFHAKYAASGMHPMKMPKSARDVFVALGVSSVEQGMALTPAHFDGVLDKDAPLEFYGLD